MNRRTFIQTSAATAAAVVSHPVWASDETHRIRRVGLQLYTVRDLIKKDFDGTLAKVAAVGYKEVEFAGYFDHSPKDVRATIDRHGLAAPSEHISYAVIEKEWPQTLEAAQIVGHRYIVCPYLEESQRTADGWKRAAEAFNRAGEASQKAGIQFAYHNHSFEFAPTPGLGDKLPYDLLLAETDPKLVKMEMDLCWISVAGKDPLTYFKQYPGRFPLVHVKDFVNDPNSTGNYTGATGPIKFHGHLADVGAGSIDWKRIFAESDEAGIKHYFVENDEPKSPVEDIRISYNYLTKLQF
jgi:sugar phosphate isomerase/epimerase